MLPPADLDVVPDKNVDDIDAELELFKTALEGVRADMRNLSTKLATQLRPKERAVRRVPDDARRRVPGQRSDHRDQDRPVGPGRAAPGGHRSRQPFRTDGRRLPARARLGRQDLGRRLLAYLQEERSAIWSTPTTPSWSAKN
jgi:phosphotransferase system enzyme I (PtsP)